MPDFDLTGELSLKIELHMLRPITEKVHSGNGPVSLVFWNASIMVLKKETITKIKWQTIMMSSLKIPVLNHHQISETN